MSPDVCPYSVIELDPAKIYTFRIHPNGKICAREVSQPMRIDQTSSIVTRGTGVPAAQLRQLLDTAGPNATFDFRIEKGDRPGETETTTITASWTTTTPEEKRS